MGTDVRAELHFRRLVMPVVPAILREAWSGGHSAIHFYSVTLNDDPDRERRAGHCNANLIEWVTYLPETQLHLRI